MGGSHGEGTQVTSETDQCHDITVFPTRKLAAGACSGNGIIFDISDPLKPKRLDVVTDKGFAYWHSATFNNDGTKVIFTDEWGGGSRPRCRSYDPRNWGADAIYDIVDNKLIYRGTYKLPAPQTETENCVAHNGSIVPVPGRDIFVQAWYQGGLSVIDFTDSANPTEIAFFDRGPISDKAEVLGGYWSTYWYNGRVYGTEIARGLDVFELLPSQYLTANEIAAAKLASHGGAFNPQQQYPVSWPDSPTVARAYIDQLQREGRFTAAQVATLSAMLDKAQARLDAGQKDAKVAAELRTHVGHLKGAAAGSRSAMLAKVMEALAPSSADIWPCGTRVRQQRSRSQVRLDGSRRDCLRALLSCRSERLRPPAMREDRTHRSRSTGASKVLSAREIRVKQADAYIQSADTPDQRPIDGARMHGLT